MIRTCKDCSKSFAVDQAEQEWLAAKSLSLPRRCLSCRASRRGVVDRSVACERCGEAFAYDAELAILVQTFGWSDPTRCIVGCDETARKNLRGERKKLAELHERRTGAKADLKAASMATAEKKATRPEDLFKGLDALIEKAATEAAATEAADEPSAPASETDSGEFGLNPLARPGEEVPSPDSLFSSLADKRKARG